MVYLGIFLMGMVCGTFMVRCLLRRQVFFVFLFSVLGNLLLLYLFHYQGIDFLSLLPYSFPFCLLSLFCFFLHPLFPKKSVAVLK